ncbi:hypothetical protein Tco_0646017 [Tanacetum coccineum]
MTFDETPPPSKTSPLVDDDLDEEEAIKVSKKKILENDIEDGTLDIDEIIIVNIKESRNHPLENVIGNLNQRTLRHVKRGRDTKIPHSSGPPVKVGDEAVHKELGDRMERAATIASSLEAKQDSGSGLRCQDTILGDVDAQTRFETTSKQSNDPPLSRGYTLRSGEDSVLQFKLIFVRPKLSAGQFNS